MGIESRVEKLENRYQNKEGCTPWVVVYDGTAKPPEGAAKQYAEDNKLCESCTHEDRLCFLYWNGETFSRDGKGTTSQ